ncbi:FGGY-family carbohydrate kinase [Thiohalomonas denitrificans]|uniref:FGGY-family carbohydrate kinase n=1 Tax=Thiohalomonas denitrificans TaxID=415747 RepID=UPI000B84AFDA|nr:FGGY-family carbohydrate kinase [Thiohalomonas denitrificans]
MVDPNYYIGIDLGTSGCRAVAIDQRGTVAGEARVDLPEPLRRGAAVEQDPMCWWQAVDEVVHALLKTISSEAVRAIAVDGTSGTVLLTDPEGRPCGAALMYNDNRAVEEANRIAHTAPAESAAHGTGSGLAKLLWLVAHTGEKATRVATQGDWIAARLTGTPGVSDENNVLKLGWDPVRDRWPKWLQALGISEQQLPEVVAPGAPLGRLKGSLATHWHLPEATWVMAGTTDSTAAIFATGAKRLGDGISSLGSTLVTKVIADRPIFAPEYGVYSQPLGDQWLVGGGSNSGGAVLKHFFTPSRMAELSERIDPEHTSGLDYYPLLQPGERFPVNDPDFAPRLAPRPANDALFLQGLLEGIAAIEAAAYQKLQQLGAPYPERIFSVGGGASNPVWEKIRGRLTGVPMVKPIHSEAAYGTALLARRLLAQA